MKNSWDLSPSEYRDIWEGKRVLRIVYADLFQRIVDNCIGGLTVEVGSCFAPLKEVIPGLIATDITQSEWLDLIANGQALPLRNGSVRNVVGVDILHHVEFPSRLIGEAARVLESGGRVVLVEPAISPVSWPFYKVLHREPVDLRADPLREGPPDPGRKPFDANQAVPTLIVGRHRARMLERHPDLRVSKVEWISPFSYPLSGGYRRWSLVPKGSLPQLLRFERRIGPRLGRLCAFRLLLVLEKV